MVNMPDIYCTYIFWKEVVSNFNIPMNNPGICWNDWIEPRRKENEKLLLREKITNLNVGRVLAFLNLRLASVMSELNNLVICRVGITQVVVVS